MSATTQERTPIGNAFVQELARREANRNRQEQRMLMDMEFPTLEDMEPEVPLWPSSASLQSARLAPEDDELSETLYTEMYPQQPSVALHSA